MIESTDQNNVNAFILAGGKSSRMGIDKGLIKFNGKSIIEYILEQLKPVVQKIVIVSNNPDYELFGVTVISDLVKDIGPAGGIYTALSHTDSESNFIVSCDMPFINSTAIQYVIQNSAQTLITVPVYHQQMEPLFAAYSRQCLAKWKELVEKGFVRLQDIISQFEWLKLNVDDVDGFDEFIFTNLNTKTDLENAFKQLSQWK